MNNLTVQELISQGSFGKIYRVIHKGTGEVLALKRVPLDILSRVDRQEAIDEARMLSKLNHPNIIRHLESFVEENMLNIVMEYAAGGTVHQMRKAGQFSEPQIWKYCVQLLQAVAYIHSKRIIHRDIKTLNVFLDDQDNVKLGDFGIARALTEGTNLLHTLVGTPFYLAPELCEDKPYNSAADIWAVGVCLYEMCMGTYPFTANNEGALIRKIMKGHYQRPSGYSADLLNVINLCLAYDPKKRPSAHLLLARPEISAIASKIQAAQARQQYVLSHTNPTNYSPGQYPGTKPKHVDHHNSKAMESQASTGNPGQNPPRHPFVLSPETPQVLPHVCTGSIPRATAPANTGTEFRFVQEQSKHGADASYHSVGDGLRHLQVAKTGVMGLTETVVPPTAHVESGQHQHIQTAGMKNNFSQRSAPYSKDQGVGSLDDTCCKANASALWTHKYERPQYARKRCPDLMVSGPSSRAVPIRGQTVKPQAVYAYDASVGSTTTYQQHTSGNS